MNDKIRVYWRFIQRHSLWILAAVVSLLIMKPGLAEIRTILFIVLFEALAIALSGIATFAFTSINFTKAIVCGADEGYSERERMGMLRVIGMIFLAVHILVGLVVLGVYIAQYAN